MPTTLDPIALRKLKVAVEAANLDAPDLTRLITGVDAAVERLRREAAEADSTDARRAIIGRLASGRAGRAQPPLLSAAPRR